MNNLSIQGFYPWDITCPFYVAASRQACFDLSVILERDQTFSLKGSSKDEMLHISLFSSALVSMNKQVQLWLKVWIDSPSH